jgi:hypothetical protein
VGRAGRWGVGRVQMMGHQGSAKVPKGLGKAGAAVVGWRHVVGRRPDDEGDTGATVGNADGPCRTRRIGVLQARRGGVSAGICAAAVAADGGAAAVAVAACGGAAVVWAPRAGPTREVGALRGGACRAGRGRCVGLRAVSAGGAVPAAAGSGARKGSAAGAAAAGCGGRVGADGAGPALAAAGGAARRRSTACGTCIPRARGLASRRSSCARRTACPARRYS